MFQEFWENTVCMGEIMRFCSAAVLQLKNKIEFEVKVEMVDTEGQMPSDK